MLYLDGQEWMQFLLHIIRSLQSCLLCILQTLTFLLFRNSFSQDSRFHLIIYEKGIYIAMRLYVLQSHCAGKLWKKFMHLYMQVIVVFCLPQRHWREISFGPFFELTLSNKFESVWYAKKWSMTSINHLVNFNHFQFWKDFGKVLPWSSLWIFLALKQAMMLFGRLWIDSASRHILSLCRTQFRSYGKFFYCSDI